jgi:hypothetical protein
MAVVHHHPLQMALHDEKSKMSLREEMAFGP